MGLRSISLAAVVLASGAIAAGCGSGTSQVTLYPLNNAKGSEIKGCRADAAKAASLPPQLRAALEANCSHPNPAALQKAVGQDCQATVASTQGIPAAVRNTLETACRPGGKGATPAVKSAAATVCQQVVRSTVPVALQPQALARCPKS